MKLGLGEPERREKMTDFKEVSEETRVFIITETPDVRGNQDIFYPESVSTELRCRTLTTVRRRKSHFMKKGRNEGRQVKLFNQRTNITVFVIS